VKIRTDVTLLREGRFMSILKVRKAVRILLRKGDISIPIVRIDDTLLRKIWTCIN